MRVRPGPVLDTSRPFPDNHHGSAVKAQLIQGIIANVADLPVDEGARAPRDRRSPGDGEAHAHDAIAPSARIGERDRRLHGPAGHRPERHDERRLPRARRGEGHRGRARGGRFSLGRRGGRGWTGRVLGQAGDHAFRWRRNLRCACAAARQEYTRDEEQERRQGPADASRPRGQNVEEPSNPHRTPGRDRLSFERSLSGAKDRTRSVASRSTIHRPVNPTSPVVVGPAAVVVGPAPVPGRAALVLLLTDGQESPKTGY